MRAFALPVAVFALVAPAPVMAEDEDEKKRRDPARIAELVRLLGDPGFATREQAGKDLLAVGEAALPALKKAAAEADVPEAATRAAKLVRRLMLTVAKSKTTGMELGLIESGEFDMGSPEREPNRRPDEKQRHVTVTWPFLMGKTEVTQEQFKAVTDRAPSWFTPTGGGKAKVPDKDTAKYAVETVTWFDAADFCNRLSKADGHPEYYTLADTKTDKDGAITSGTVTVAGGSGYRLPTEAEWELAARGGSKLSYSFGGEARGGEGNFKYTRGIGYGGTEEVPSLGRVGKVGAYKPNRNALYDVHGNAAEWVQDWYEKDYPDPSPADPTGPAKGDQRAVRGGSWMSNDANVRCAARFFLAPGDKKDYVGFRVARTP